MSCHFCHVMSCDVTSSCSRILLPNLSSEPSKFFYYGGGVAATRFSKPWPCAGIRLGATLSVWRRVRALRACRVAGVGNGATGCLAGRRFAWQAAGIGRVGGVPRACRVAGVGDGATWASFCVAGCGDRACWRCVAGMSRGRRGGWCDLGIVLRGRLRGSGVLEVCRGHVAWQAWGMVRPGHQFAWQAAGIGRVGGVSRACRVAGVGDGATWASFCVAGCGDRACWRCVAGMSRGRRGGWCDLGIVLRGRLRVSGVLEVCRGHVAWQAWEMVRLGHRFAWLSCHVTSCSVMSRHVTSCHVTSCRVMTCHVMSCHVMSCHVM